MSNVVVIGAQWGDEGKGKIVDWLSERADVIVRFQGGHNAGHTLVIDGEVYKLSLLPSGVVRPGKLSIIGNGVVIDPKALLDEIDRIRKAGVIITTEQLKLSETAAVILPLHQELDLAREAARGKAAIGTTGRGIGPAYEDKVARRGIRVCDLAEPETLKSKVEHLLHHHNALHAALVKMNWKASSVLDLLNKISEEILSYAAPVWRELEIARKAVNGFYLKVRRERCLILIMGHTHSSHRQTQLAAAATGSGVGIGALDFVLGITKAYTTRVGSGPFPTELKDNIGQRIGERGHEFGTVTGRQRRCGWFR